MGWESELEGTSGMDIIQVEPQVEESEQESDSQQADRLEQEFSELIEGDYDYERPQRGEVREGVILSIGESDMVVDMGGKRDGIVQAQDLERLDEEYRASLKVGDPVPVVVLKTWGRREGILVSINKGLQREDWLRAQELLDQEQVVEAPVIDVNRGGVLVSFGRLRGFVPNSHLTSIRRGLRGQALRDAKAELVGQTLSLVVIEVEQQRRRLVLSERKAQRQQRERLLHELNAGDIRTGTVSHLADFGAFVDLGGIDGLAHISELDWQHVNHPREVVKEGDEIEVYVLGVDRKKGHVRLSRKRLLPDPWLEVTSDLKVGQVVEGTVRNVVDFGAFVDVGKGVEGLVHISEMPRGAETLSELEGDAQIQVRVLEIDQERRRIALSMRRTDYVAAILASSSWERSGDEASVE